VSPDDRAAATGHPSAASSAAEWEPLRPPGFGHLRKLTAPIGLWEHALISTPRVEHGFCTDDNARALVVVTRQPPAGTDLTDLAAIYIQFVLDARTPSGQFHNRRDAGGTWIDDLGSDDSQGRAWWGLGAAARLGPTASMREAAAKAFDTCRSFDSPHLRANAYATLGAVEMLAANPGHAAATDLLERTSEAIADAALGRIPWPETRLTYDNARLPDALIAAGATLGRRRLTLIGLRMLKWLVGVETNGDHFSFTPVGGWAPGEPRPGFDQQPIEAWAMADAAHRAWTVTGDEMWRVRALRAGSWLTGRNDTGMVLYDAATGGTCDGLMKHSANENRGAESTLSGIGTLQVAAWHDEGDDELLVR
jgi:hypothetical protein